MPAAGATPRTLVEIAVAHERWTTATVLIALPLACWTWIALLARDMYGSMTGPSAWMMTGTWDVPHLALLWAMWAVMTTAMMLPRRCAITEIASGRLVALPVVGVSRKRQVMLVCRKSHRSHAANAFLEVAQGNTKSGNREIG